jgi:hypothetical protein
MKLFLEEDTDEDKDGIMTKVITLVKEVKNMDEAKALKKKDKTYVHKCYHDEKIRKPCTREVI